MQALRKVLFGANEVTFEPPDTMYVVASGDVDGATARKLIEELVSWSQDKPYVLLVVNVIHLSSFSTEARKVLTSNGHRLPPRALALFGGSFATQVLLDLMDRASWLLGSKNRRARHWPDESSARAWAAEMRTFFSTNARITAQSR